MQTPRARRVRPGNSPQRAVVRRRTPHIPPPVPHLATDPRPNVEIQPLALSPEINLLSLYRKSTSCNFAAFCKRCRTPTLTKPISQPSVAFDLRVASQPLAILPLFARGAAALIRRPPLYTLPPPSTRARPINLLQFCRFLQEVPQPDFDEPHSTALRGLPPARSQSTSCNFAAFCKRCRSPISMNPILRPSVASNLLETIQPLAILPFFARGVAARFRRTPFHRSQWHPRAKLRIDLSHFCHFLQEIGAFGVENDATCQIFLTFSGR